MTSWGRRLRALDSRVVPAAFGTHSDRRHASAWNSPPGWPAAPPGWQPPAGWQPDPAWPAAPADWEWWKPAEPTAAKRAGTSWLLAAVTAFVLSFLALVLGLLVPSLALVYLSILLGLAWLPLLVIGLVRLMSQRS